MRLTKKITLLIHVPLIFRKNYLLINSTYELYIDELG